VAANERLNAALLAAALTGDQRYWSMAEAAAIELVPVPWHFRARPLGGRSAAER